MQIDSFRLRSNSANIWLGSMAGADSLGARITVNRGETPVKQFETDTSSIQGGLAIPGRTQRLNRLIVEVAKRIAEGV